MKKAIFIKGSDLEYVAASHEDPANPGALKKVLFAADLDIRGKLQMVNWAKMESGRSFELHYHQDMTEVFVIVDGQAKMNAGSEDFVMSAGDAILVPPGCPHTMTNTGNYSLHYMVFGISEEKGGKTINL